MIKFGQFGYMHRSLNYAWLQCHTFKLEAKKEAADAWTDLGNFETEALKVEDYQLFEVAPYRSAIYQTYLHQGAPETRKRLMGRVFRIGKRVRR
ncbi:MAG: hypothetical protein V8Q76_03745 [Bacteroides intestinalis]